jgi:hypothetical protein
MKEQAQAEEVHIHVDALEFEGMRILEPGRVQAAFQGELSRLVVERGLPERLSRGGADSQLNADVDGGALRPHELENPERLGRAVAGLVYAGLCR